MESEWISDNERNRATAAQQQRPPEFRLSNESMAVASLLERGDIQGFMREYISLLVQNNNALLGFLSPTFKIKTNNILEFLHTIFITNVPDQKWSALNFFITVMNLGLTVQADGPAIFYDKLMLAPPNEPSPIYHVVTFLKKEENGAALNDSFNKLWNSYFNKKEHMESPKIGQSVLSSLSRNNQFAIIVAVVILLFVLLACGSYFINKSKGASFGFVKDVVASVPSKSIIDF